MHPIRCFNCGKVFGNKFEEFNKLKETKNKDWISNLRSVEVIPEKTIESEIKKIPYTLKQPARLRFTINNIDQDFLCR